MLWDFFVNPNLLKCFVIYTACWNEPQGRQEHFSLMLSISLRGLQQTLIIHALFSNISMGKCKKDITPLLKHWSYVFLALTHRYNATGHNEYFVTFLSPWWWGQSQSSLTEHMDLFFLQSIPWPLVTSWLKEPGHQQSWYWPISHRIIWHQHQRVKNGIIMKIWGIKVCTKLNFCVV